jgi:hypothetical protein
MCDRCRKIDTQTEYYQKLAKLVIDRAALDALDHLIEGYRRKNVASIPNRRA